MSLDFPRLRTPCHRCLRPASTCFCAGLLQPLEAGPLFVILIHPKERRKTVGSARMAWLCLKDSRLIQGVDFSSHEEINRMIENPAHHCVVLYPGSGAIDISLDNGQELMRAIPQERRLVVFVIDGTWPCARRMLKLSGNLAALPQIAFNPAYPSAYKFRRQPHPKCLSTIESIYETLRLLEPHKDYGILLQLFHRMVEHQLSFAGRNLRRCHPS